MTEVLNEYGELLGKALEQGPPLRYVAIGYDNGYRGTEIDWFPTEEEAIEAVREWHRG